MLRKILNTAFRTKWINAISERKSRISKQSSAKSLPPSKKTDDFIQLQRKMRTVLSLLSDLNNMERTVSRLKNELNEQYAKLDDKLDGE